MKSCGACRYFNVSEAEAAYSEVTPGNMFAMYCYKDHWDFNAYKVTAAELVAIFTAAENCPDFEVKL